tara:strand:+ start:2223 stop:2924 length:702 start_codon:yes stop_codon:yes gene_type:complete
MRHRSNLPELMDDPHLDSRLLKRALEDVSLVNKWLGGHKVTIEGLEYFFKNYKQTSYTLVDLGCGDGEMLRNIAEYGRDKGIKLQLIGLDLNEKSIELAKGKSTNFPEITFAVQDILKLNSKAFNCDIIVCSLTMHHFNDEEILDFLNCFKKLARLGSVINDLHRSRIAYNLFYAFSNVFMNSYIARNDGLISIKRAFKRNELKSLADNVGISNYSLKWRWAFRYLWIIKNQA